MPMEVFAAVMVMELSVAAVTFSASTFEATLPCPALIFADPTALPVASPAALMLAPAVFEELHVTELVRFCVLPSLKVPVAVN